MTSATSRSTIQPTDLRSLLGEVQSLAIRPDEPPLFYAGAFHRRGDGLDGAGRSAQPSAAAFPLQAESMEQLARGFVAGWI